MILVLPYLCKEGVMEDGKILPVSYDRFQNYLLKTQVENTPLVCIFFPNRHS